MVAYALYKREKIDFIVRFEKNNPGVELSEDDLDRFHNTYDSNDARLGLHTRADEIIEEMIDQAIVKRLEKLDEKTKQIIIEEYFTRVETRYEDLYVKRVGKIHRTWLGQLLLNVVASVISAIVIYCTWLLLSFFFQNKDEADRRVNDISDPTQVIKRHAPSFQKSDSAGR